MRRDAKAAIMALLEKRGSGKTICPSEVARILASEDEGWQSQMPLAHQAVDALITADAITLSWKGEVLDRRHGAYRIARRQPSNRKN